MHEIARALQEEDGGERSRRSTRGQIDPRWESEVEYSEREQEEARAQRHVDDVFGAIAQRDPSNEGQRHTQQQDECSNNDSQGSHKSSGQSRVVIGLRNSIPYRGPRASSTGFL